MFLDILQNEIQFFCSCFDFQKEGSGVKGLIP